MKRYLFLIVLSFTSLANSQELVNFYLEPNITSGYINLHTTVYRSQLTSFSEYEINYSGNIIDIFLCYLNSTALVNTTDNQDFEIELPTGYSSYTINIELHGDDDGLPCTMTNLMDTGTLTFDYPYQPTDTTYIPDDNFESYLEILNIGDDINNNDLVFTHRIENLSRLRIDYNTLSMEGLGLITEIIGIEDFISLNLLYCYGNLITNLDLYNNTNLETLVCYANLYTSLVFLNNINLKVLQCGGENLSSLIVSNNLSLEELGFYGNNITDINLANNTNLRELRMSTTQIIDLNINANTLLEHLGFSNNIFTTIDLSNNINLESIECYGNLLTELNVDAQTNLISLYCYQNQVNQLDLSTCAQLETAYLASNNLIYLDVSNGNNENLNLVTIGNIDLNCIQVDDVEEAKTYGWNIDPWTIFSESCPPIGLEESFIKNNISIYPNPTKDHLYIDPKGLIIHKIEIFDLLGRKVLIEKDNFDQLDLTNLCNGILSVRIETEKGVVVKKVLKQ